MPVLTWIRTQDRYPKHDDISRGIVVAWQRDGQWHILQTHLRDCGMPMAEWWTCAYGSAPEVWVHADTLLCFQ